MIDTAALRALRALIAPSTTSTTMPATAMVNGLQLSPKEEDCHLTELENNLIAQNINFQYKLSIYFLPAKVKMGGNQKTDNQRPCPT